MARIIKAPNVQNERPYRVVERHKVLKHADDEADEIVHKAQQKEKKILKDASEQKGAILASAEEEKQSILAEAQREAGDIKQNAKQEGHQEGLNEGRQEARQEVSGVLNDLGNMLREGQQILENMFFEQEHEIRKLVADLVSRVVKKKIEEDDEVVVRVTKECIKLAADRQTLNIYVHPEDKEKIEAWVPHFTQIFDEIEKVNIAVDTRVDRGGVIIESGTGGIDGRVDKQIEILNDTLLNS